MCLSQSHLLFKPREIVQNLLDDSNIIYYNQRAYNDLKKSDAVFNKQFFVLPQNDKSAVLFESVLQEHYKNELYHNRNRIAHNTLSYQQNLPNLDSLVHEDGLTRNYFFWFAILVLIDEIFMKLYECYSKCLRDNSYFDN